MTIIAVHSSVNTRRKLLILKLGSTESAIDNPMLQGICNYDVQDSIANSGYILGVVDWHGISVPVVEGYSGLSQGAAVRNEPALVILVNAADNFVSISVDSVLDVITLSHEQDEQMKTPSESSKTINARSFAGLCLVSEHVLTVLNVD